MVHVSLVMLDTNRMGSEKSYLRGTGLSDGLERLVVAFPHCHMAAMRYGHISSEPCAR
jgi:hypothetical protein